MMVSSYLNKYRMSNRLIVIFIFGISIGVFFAFSYFDAKAFEHESISLVERVRQNCENEKKYLAKTTTETLADKGEYLEQLAEAEDPDERERLTKEMDDLDFNLYEIKAWVAKKCGPDIEAAIEAQAKADRDYYKGLITGCQYSKKNYKRNIRNVKAKGLSAQYFKENIAQMIKDIKNEQKRICGFAKKARAALKKGK